jgi:hypothetical protein
MKNSLLVSARRLPGLAALAGLLLLTPHAAAAADYYVSGTGNDASSGSETAPFRQIRRALQVVTTGDTVLVSDGEYLGFDVRLNATAAAPVTVRALGSGAIVVPTSDRADNRDTIHIAYSSHVILDGLRSFQANRAAVRVNSSQRITIRNGVFGNNRYWGIFTNHSDDLLIENNECYGSVAEHGIYTSNSGDRPVLRGNRCHDNYGCGIHMNADLSAGGDGVITGAVVENNRIYRNGQGGGAGINMDGVQESVVRNNLVFNNLGSGIALFRQDGAAGPRGVQVLHNTVDMPSTGRWALLVGSAADTNYVRNNILLNRGTFRGGLNFGSLTDASLTDSNYNLLDRVSTDGGQTAISLSQWQSQGHEPYSLSAAPASLFVDPAAGDYHLLATAPAVDAGQALPNVPVDLDGQPRPAGTAPDIGCYEYAQGTQAPIERVVLESVTVSPTQLRGGGTATGTVTLDRETSVDVVVLLSSSEPKVAAVSASVTIPAGSRSVNFTLTTKRVRKDVSVTIAGTAGVTRSTTLLVTAR